MKIKIKNKMKFQVTLTVIYSLNLQIKTQALKPLAVGDREEFLQSRCQREMKKFKLLSSQKLYRAA